MTGLGWTKSSDGTGMEDKSSDGTGMKDYKSSDGSGKDDKSSDGTGMDYVIGVRWTTSQVTGLTMQN